MALLALVVAAAVSADAARTDWPTGNLPSEFESEFGQSSCSFAPAEERSCKREFWPPPERRAGMPVESGSWAQALTNSDADSESVFDC